MSDVLAPLLLVASAAVFGPLTGWLAARRERSVALWFGFGLLLGPIAAGLVAVAPPGRCPACGTPATGWLRTCQACGAAMDGSSMPAQGRPGDFAPGVATGGTGPGRGRPPARPATSPTAGSATQRSTVAAADLVAVGARPVSEVARSGPEANGRTFTVADGTGIGVGAAAATATAAETVGSHAVAAAPRRSSSDVGIMGTGVFVGGSVQLVPGTRYSIVRRRRDLEILGPLDTAPGSLVISRPLTGLDATVVADRLVVTERSAGRPDFVMVFQALAVNPGVDLESAFGTRRRTRAPRRSPE